MAVQLKINPETVQAKKLYLYSLLYLALLFAAMAVDSALFGATTSTWDHIALVQAG